MSSLSRVKDFVSCTLRRATSLSTESPPQTAAPDALLFGLIHSVRSPQLLRPLAPGAAVLLALPSKNPSRSALLNLPLPPSLASPPTPCRCCRSACVKAANERSVEKARLFVLHFLRQKNKWNSPAWH